MTGHVPETLHASAAVGANQKGSGGRETEANNDEGKERQDWTRQH